MSEDRTLTLLMERVQEQHEADSQALGQATGYRDQQAHKLQVLHGYRAEYQDRLDRSSTTGIGMGELINYRRFLTQLDQAVAQQRRALEQSELSLQAARVRWQESRRSLKSYEVLIERRARAAALKASRREQREMDGYAARMAQRQPHS